VEKKQLTLELGLYKRGIGMLYVLAPQDCKAFIANDALEGGDADGQTQRAAGQQ